MSIIRVVLFAVGLSLGVLLAQARADPIGILPHGTGGLPNGPFSSTGGTISSPGTPVSIAGQGELSPNPSDVWQKQITWNYTVINPGDVLCINESITLFNPPSMSFTLTDWEEELISSNPDFSWHSTSSISVNGAPPIAGQVTGSQIRFDYGPVTPGSSPSGPPVMLDIEKYIQYTGSAAITSGAGQDSITFLVREQPSVPEPSAVLPLALGLPYWIVLRRRRR